MPTTTGNLCDRFLDYGRYVRAWSERTVRTIGKVSRCSPLTSRGRHYKHSSARCASGATYRAGSMCGSARSTATWSDLVDTFRKADTMSRMPESSKGRRPRRQFDEEFRNQAVRLVLDDHKTVGAVARDLDLTPSALRLWVTRPRPIARTVVPA